MAKQPLKSFSDALNGKEFKERYDVVCPCGHEFTAAPSLLMRSGFNNGGASCPGCGSYLTLSINDDNATMTAEKRSAHEDGGEDA